MKLDFGKFGETLRYFTQGYAADVPEILRGRESAQTAQVLFRNLPCYSLCEHHLLPFYGTCDVAYLPKGKLLGLSRAHALVAAFSLRLQLQEKLTQEIADAFMKHVKPNGVAVRLRATHLCTLVSAGKPTEVETTAFEGAYAKKAALRKEFLLRTQPVKKK